MNKSRPKKAKPKPRFKVDQIVVTNRLITPVIAGKEATSLSILTGSRVVILEVAPFAGSYRYRVEQVDGYKVEAWVYEQDLEAPLLEGGGP
jgi:hypothetical protein